MTRARPGGVLIVVVVATLLMAMLTTGLLKSTLLARQAVDARAHILAARLDAQSAVAEAFADWQTRQHADLPIGAEKPVPAGDRTVRAFRASAGTFIVTADGRARDGRTRARAGAILRTLVLRDLWATFAAAVTGGEAPVVTGGHIRSDAGADFMPGMRACDGAPDSLAQIVGMPPPVLVLHDTLATARLGPLPLDSLARVADRTESGALVLEAVQRDGRCDRGAAGNWGAPEDPFSPCADYLPLIVAPGDLTVRGGAGQGVLVVLGSLQMHPGTRFHGPIVVARDAALTGARLYGALRVTGHTLLEDTDVSYNACNMLRSLIGAPGLNRAFRPPGRWWIPQF